MPPGGHPEAFAVPTQPLYIDRAKSAAVSNCLVRHNMHVRPG